MKKNDPTRITPPDERLTEACEIAEYLVAKRGTRAIAQMLQWTMADVSRIANAKWREIRIYPEHLIALRLAHDIVRYDDKLIEPLRTELHELNAEIGALGRRVTSVRKKISKVAR